MFVSQLSGDAAAWRSVQESDLDKEWLVDLLDRVGFLGEGSGEGVHPYRTPLILLDNRQQQLPVNFVEAMTIHFQHVQRGLGGG